MSDDSTTREIIIRVGDRVTDLEKSMILINHNQLDIVSQLKEINETIKTGIRFLSLAPVTISGIGATSWLFFNEKIQEHNWMIFCVVFLSPYYGDIAKLLLGKIKINGNHK